MTAGEVLNQIISLTQLDGEQFTDADVIGLIGDLINTWKGEE
jgi:hypothetical protein